MEQHIPELTAWNYGDGVHIITWCKYCFKYHWHGLGGDDGGGHRVAHCALDTPYKKTGYELIPAGPAPARIINDIKREKSKGPAEFREKSDKKTTGSISFSNFIKKNVERNDPLGDFAIDFKYKLDHWPYYTECRGADKIVSETLFGHYQFLAVGAQNRESVVEGLFALWREWLGYKHIGLKFGKPKRGYVYIFKLKTKDDVFKIGRTEQSPKERLSEVARQEKAELVLHDWMLIDHYDIIEKELHAIFKKDQIAREWFQVDKNDIDEVLYLYSLTDQTCIVNSYQEYEGDEMLDEFV